MKRIVSLKEGGYIEIEIEHRLISKASYTGITTKTVDRTDELQVKYWLEIIFKDDVKAFKAILEEIREDETYFSYGKNLLEAEKERRTHRMLKYQRECVEKIKRMQEEINEFTFT